MKRSEHRILTTHTGSLARPDDLLEPMRAKENGLPYDREAFDSRARVAVIEAVHRQLECGVDVPSDGEQSKSGFGSYQAERIGGFEPVDPQPPRGASPWREVPEFPEYYERYFKFAMAGAMLAPPKTLVCTAPVKYVGQAALQRDIDNFKAGLEGQRYEEAFIPSANPLGFMNVRNEYYASDEEYHAACIDAMREEYSGIINAGFLLQIDDPGAGDLWRFDRSDQTELRKQIDRRVELMNYALRDLPMDRIRIHTCYSINQGPHIYDLHLRDFIGPLLRMNAQAVSFEVMNPRHMHDYHTFEDVRLPDGKIIIPGMLSHGANWVEHPEWIAELTCNYARLVGRENVMIGNDCGFASQAGSREIDPKVAWKKLEALNQGARLATQRLWGD
jgi:5-methyltetrahydropteroyltriglutamate--homocysteine methyltransferase